MNKVLDGYVEQSRKMKQTDNLFVLDPLHTPDKPILLRLRCISNHNKLFRKTMCDPKLVEIVSDLLGPSIRYINQEKVNMKPPQSSSSLIRWHQDWAFFPYTNDSLVTVCIAIDDSSRENGCLQVLPGSHKGPLYSHFQDGAFVSAITDPALDPSSAVHIEVPAGGVSFHHAFTVHGFLSKSIRTFTSYVVL
ncbi:hypothetical protein OS493_011821 [Desmophyllum pertusum]|uniref:Phytanoyl-CoA dioxygenase family protein n=1 Tax=Desmophyllum pertusum TaxID=174260 RepID=A0A9W9YHC4_9CNID|nr:hypothetical protein OS493_011821 [Desmophyllum pertusum]